MTHFFGCLLFLLSMSQLETKEESGATAFETYFALASCLEESQQPGTFLRNSKFGDNTDLFIVKRLRASKCIFLQPGRRDDSDYEIALLEQALLGPDVPNSSAEIEKRLLGHIRNKRGLAFEYFQIEGVYCFRREMFVELGILSRSSSEKMCKFWNSVDHVANAAATANFHKTQDLDSLRSLSRSASLAFTLFLVESMNDAERAKFKRFILDFLEARNSYVEGAEPN
ncbi:MAG: hypothetical protein AAF802_20780 [Planctomycetota bacterium]